eukprot:jgi/Mesvir1/1187/Mv17681-RA.1
MARRETAPRGSTCHVRVRAPTVTHYCNQLIMDSALDDDVVEAKSFLLPSFSPGVLQAVAHNSHKVANQNEAQLRTYRRCVPARGSRQVPLHFVAPKFHQSRRETIFRPGLVVAHSSADDLLAGIEMPPIFGDLRDMQEDAGGVFDDEGSGGPLTFGNDQQALAAARGSGFAVYDKSHYGRIRVVGADRISFLHNMTTANISRLKPGQGCETLFVSPQARTIDLASLYVQESSVMLSIHPTKTAEILKLMDKYIFPADKVKPMDVSDKCFSFALIGKGAAEALTSFGAGDILSKPAGSHALFQFQGNPVMLSVGCGLSIEGFTVIADAPIAGDVWSAFVQAGGVPMGETAFEVLRVAQGRPAPGRELTADYNPLEAALYSAVSIDKGCYIGQETIARLITYDGVKQQLWGLRLDTRVEPGADIVDGDQKIGKLTSCCEDLEKPGRFLGLGYIKRKAEGMGAGVSVMVGSAPATLVDIPYASRSLPTA